MLNFIARSININHLSGGKTIFGREGIKKIKNNKVSFCSKIAKHLHQPEIFNGSRVFAHSLIIKSKRGSAGEPLAFGDFGDILPKESIFRQVSAEILPKPSKVLFIIVRQCT